MRPVFFGKVNSFFFFAETLDARFGGSNKLELYVYGTIGAISAVVFLFFFFRII